MWLLVPALDTCFWHNTPHMEDILPKGPHLPCLPMADRALLAGYPRYITYTIIGHKNYALCFTHIFPSYCTGTVTIKDCTWWRHQMETFSALLALCVGNSPVLSEFPTQRPVMRSCDVFFDLGLNKRLSKTIGRLVIWDAIAPIMTSL